MSDPEQPLTRAQRRGIEAVLDRIEDRLADAEPGLFMMGSRASDDELAASPLPEGAQMLWAQWNGMDLANGELVLLPLREMVEATRALADQLEDGEEDAVPSSVRDPEAPVDLVIGHRGPDPLLFAGDPWEHGADVLLLDEIGEAAPYASSVEHLVLGVMGEISVLYDQIGEFQESLFDEETGELTPRAERRLLRRRLDLDPDAPAPRLRLAQLLRRSGELRGAKKELENVVKRAPQFAWAQFELGRVRHELGQRREAHRAFEAACEKPGDDGLEALFCAWRALTAPDEATRATCARRTLALYPSYVKNAEAGAREALSEGDVDRARQLVLTGLAVEPGHLGLLALRPSVPEPPREASEDG